VIWLDIDYQLKNRPFTVDPERFPHFDQMIKDLKAEHLRTVLITDLHIAALPNAGYKPYDEGTGGDHFVKNADGSTYVGVVWPGKAVFPDFTREAVARVVGHALLRLCEEGRGRVLERHE
jgi:alpha-glucosidase